MAEDRVAMREVIWQEVCPWLILVRAVRVAIGPRVLILASLALIATAAGFRTISQMSDGVDDPAIEDVEYSFRHWPWEFERTPFEPSATEEEAQVFVDPAENVVSWQEAFLRIPFVGPLLERTANVVVWDRLARPFTASLNRNLSSGGLVYLLLCGIWSLLVWALFGGAIARIASLALTRHEQLGLFSAFSFGRRKLGSFFFAPAMPLAGVLFIMVCMAALGLIMLADIGLILAALFWPIVLIVGLFLAIVLIGLLFGYPLMWSTISTEGTDSFDALSRSYAYVFQRPLRLLFFVLVAALLGALGSLVVDLFASVLVDATRVGASWGMGDERAAEVYALVDAREGLATPDQPGVPDEPGVLLRTGVWLLGLWHNVVYTLQVAFLFGFFWVSAVAIYLLLRRSVDATEMDECYIEGEEDETGLPPLATDASGVPAPADEQSP